MTYCDFIDCRELNCSSQLSNYNRLHSNQLAAKC